MPKTPQTPTAKPDPRQARLAEALRANLARRKARARGEANADQNPDTPPGPQSED